MNDNARVAVLSVHTSPMDQPGTGDSGGMNVYVRAVAERLARRGVAVDLFTRCRGGADHEVKILAPGIRVVSVKAGPCDHVPKAELPRFLPEFLGGVLRVAHEDGRGYDIVHTHYWLSGWVGRAMKDSMGARCMSVCTFDSRTMSFVTSLSTSGSTVGDQCTVSRRAAVRTRQ